MGNLSVRECITKVYRAARDGSSDLGDLLNRLQTTEQRKTALETKTKDGNHFSTPLIIAAHNGHLNSVKILLTYGANIETRGTLTIGDEVVKGCTPLLAAAASGHLDVVKLFIDKGAFMDLQDEDGYTALHSAVKGGHINIVSELLALGASQLPNKLGLTPLLYACDECFIEMVEHIINRPECTKEQRIDALELLAATVANNSSGDSEKAFSYMKRGMEERYEDPANPLLKKKMEPVEAYQNRKESQTLEELALLEGDDHAIGMEGLIIQERILGPGNPVNLPYIDYRASVLADSEKYELGCGLYQRGLEKAMNMDQISITEVLYPLTVLFGVMVQKGILIRPNSIEDAFEKLVAASEERTEKLKSKNSQEEHEKEEQEKTIHCALYLLMIYIKVKGQNTSMTEFLQRFLRLNPRTHDGNTLLHLAESHKTPNADFLAYDIVEEADMQSVYKLPCVETMKLILHAGGDVNAVNTEGNTPLHLAVKFKPTEPEEVEILREMLLLMLDIGADPKLANKNGQTPLDSCETDEARRILSEKRPAGLSAINVDVGDAGKIGTGDRKGGGGFVPGKEKYLNENTQKKTETKEASGQLKELRLQLENVQEQLRQRDGQLREATQQLTNVQGQLQERDGELRQMTQLFAIVQGQLRELTQLLTNTQRELQEKDEENTTMGEQLREKEQEVNELEISLSTAQQALRGRPRQQSPDWVISRDQIQLTEKCLGKGGWGSVVEGKYCGCSVAVKQPYKELLKHSPHNREKFEREMSIASKCRHPCLLQFIGATNDEGSPLFVTELMESSLRRLLEQRSLSTAEVAVISLDVAYALNYLHQKKPRPIIHRDISSANVLLWRQADQWRGKVSDYGAANIMQHAMSVCPGAAIYSAPEAYTENQTTKVDVYSFGVLLCEMSTGKLPDLEMRDEQVAMVTNRVFRALIRRCLHKDPQERSSMEDVIGELEKLV